MNIVRTPLPGVLVLEPKVFGDSRGFFLESYNQRAFDDAVGSPVRFVQDNHSRSSRGVLRGLHYQLQQSQGKLVRVVQGAVLDVAVDLRKSSPTYGRWTAVELTAANQRQCWVPPGFGHGFVVTSDTADFLYKTTDYYAPQHERSIRWDDPDLAIDWRLAEFGISAPSLSAKDLAGAGFRDAETYP